MHTPAAYDPTPFLPLLDHLGSAAAVADDEWQRLLDHYRAIHTLTPASGVALPPAVLNMSSATDGLDRIRQQLAYMPEGEQPADLHELIGNVEAARLPEWPAPPFALCRVD